LFLVLLLPSLQLVAQRKIVQVSGIVVGGDSLYGIPAVAVYLERNGRGTFTNEYGYFSVPVMGGDTLTVKGIGYVESQIYIPDTTDQIAVMVRLDLDTFMLPEVVLWPYPTFESFKKAFLAMEIEKPQHQSYAEENLNARVLQRMMYNTEASANMNHRYFMGQNAQRNIYIRNNLGTTLLNPFAWARFIKDVKSGGLRNKEWEEIEKEKDEER
jgi:hypothetical protein